MPSVKSVVGVEDWPWVRGKVKRRYIVTLTDSQGADHTSTVLPKIVDPSDGGAAIGNRLLRGRAVRENDGKDRVSLWSETQADYDRVNLGLAMQLTDVDDFYAVLPLFKAMETRGGNNANARAAYLGVTRGSYNLMAARFNDVEGIAFFLDDAKAQIWRDIPDEWR